MVIVQPLRYGSGEVVGVGDTVAVDGHGLGSVRGRDRLCAPGEVVVNFGGYQDVVVVGEASLVASRAATVEIARASLFTGRLWDRGRVGWAVAAVVVVLSWGVAVVSGWVWLIGELL